MDTKTLENLLSYILSTDTQSKVRFIREICYRLPSKDLKSTERMFRRYNQRRKSKNIVIPDRISTFAPNTNFDDLKYILDDIDWNLNEYNRDHLFFILSHLMKMCNEKELKKCITSLHNMKGIVLSKDHSAKLPDAFEVAQFHPIPQESSAAPSGAFEVSLLHPIPQKETSVNPPSSFSSTNAVRSSNDNNSNYSDLTGVSEVALFHPVPQSTSEWWSVFGNCEFVRVIRNGKNFQKCATLSIFDWNENEVLNRKVYYKPGEFVADKYLKLITGFTATSFLDGTPFEIVRKEVINLLKGKLCIVCGGKADIASLEIDSASLFTRKETINPPITFYDIQEYYWYFQTLDNGSVHKYPHSLRSLSSYLLNSNIQSGSHSASVDSIHTLKIFKYSYCTSPKPKKNSHPSSEIPFKFLKNSLI
ncbi:hypothetical protein B4U80_13736 [Leptotrombidium deliense]|uniref:Uncharacterized protein n=1 Tax=Leptotrombidium deliense TaxID=299467 RepID=A0A443SH96_9ACAR|nr:hypothetical protein B4U80_13736 [Leptotrombidium deliense]